MREDELLTVAEAAEKLKVSDATVRRWVASERLPCVRFGRLIRIPRDKLSATSVSESNNSRRPVPGSPEALLACAGMISKADAEAMRKAINEAFENIEE